MKQNIKIAMDAVVFGFQNDQRYVLLIQQKFGTNILQCTLPGGLVQNEETLHNAIMRELKEETEKYRTKSKRRPAKLFRFNLQKYSMLAKNDFILK